MASLRGRINTQENGKTFLCGDAGMASMDYDISETRIYFWTSLIASYISGQCATPLTYTNLRTATAPIVAVSCASIAVLFEL